MAKQIMLTTKDNPYDPFEDFTSWFLFDIEKGYNTCGKLMRIAKVSNDMSEVEYNKEVDRAIDRIIELDFLDIFKKTEKEVPDED